MQVDEGRFPRRDWVHESPGFAQGKNRVGLEIDTGLGAVEIG